jgi:hypothetical protein
MTSKIVDAELIETLQEAGYHPIVVTGDEPAGFRTLMECEGWYPGCTIFVPEGEFDEGLCSEWAEE